MSSQSLTPVEEIPIIGSCRPFHFDMSLNFSAIMFPQERSLIAEDPSFPICYMPVLVRDPEHAFVRVAASGPALELLKQDEATVMECICRYHAAIVVGPAMY